mmetsp:Transcript_3651/g.8467  ORF Transcript_3651/g.8467 Transcript_3651/m.8467 type:complete len:124 (+) Transcript_3651:34-405(+)
MIFDAGLIVYIGLLVLGLCRWLSGWRLCGRTLQYTNYCSLLYILLLVLFIYAVGLFVHAAALVDGLSSWHNLPGWLRPLVGTIPDPVCFDSIDSVRKDPVCMSSFRLVVELLFGHSESLPALL